jgi:hypothetical protein
VTKVGAPFWQVEAFARKHPRWMWAANVLLIVFVTIVLLIATEAPVVLYQAF